MADIENKLPAAVERLCSQSQDFWTDTLSEFPGLDERGCHILLICVEALHRRVMARQILEERGLTFEDRLHNLRARPEVKIQQDAELIFLRGLRQLTASLPREESGMPYKRMGRIFYAQRQDRGA